MPNFDRKPEGMSYAQWLREKNLSIKVVEAVHTDTNVPLDIHNDLKNRPHELFERALSKQGKTLDPEDIGNE